MDRTLDMNRKGFILLPLLIIILLVIAVVYFAYQNYQLKQNSSNITTLKTNEPVANNLSTSSVKPSPVNKTLSWKVYSNDEFSFKYPETWKVEGVKVFKSDQSIEMWAITSDGPLYNECMKLDLDQVVGDLRVKSFSGVTTAEMCDSINLTLREKWIVKPNGEGYQPGLQYSYKTHDSSAEEIFNLIMSTFIFK